MKFTNLGGATAILEHKGKRMLFDPWLDDGIFHGAWYHWPKMQVGIEDLGRFDYIYISHIHEDHCSAGTIKHLNTDAEIIVMEKKPNFVLKFLKENDFNFKKVHVIPARTEIEIAPGLKVNMVEPDPANEMAFVIDSALVIRWDDFILYNANDCQPHADGLKYIKDYYGRVDYALLPYAGGSGYPSCYVNLSEAEKKSEQQRVMMTRLNTFVKTVQELQPRHVTPFADQYVVAGSRSHLNRYISHPASPGVVQEALAAVGLKDRLVMLNSGQAYDFDKGVKTPDAPYQDVTEADREEYIAKVLKPKIYDHEKVTFFPSVPVDRLVKYARDRLWAIQQRKSAFSDLNLYLDFPGVQRRFRLPLNAADCVEVPWEQELQQPFLRVSGTDTLMIMILIGHISWNIADAALFLDYERRPNVYDPSVYVLLNYLRV
jgi:UDP-MurNAc hydroxylase